MPLLRGRPASLHCFTGFALRLWLPVIIASTSVSEALAHPGSGIVVDRQGIVYFVDTGSGIWRIDHGGHLTRIPGPAYHWMAIDNDDQLKSAKLPYFTEDDATVTRAGNHPTLLVSSDFPLVVGREGSLYFPWRSGTSSLQVFRLAPSGTTATFAELPQEAGGRPLQWLNGMAAGPDGAIYYTDDRAIRKITPDGKLVTVVGNITHPQCERIPGVESESGPYLRGLDVDARGTVYVAASGCGVVLKVTAEGGVTEVLRATSPWSPTGVAVSRGDVYVLEYLHTASDNRREWIPRIRKLSSDGHVVTVATIER